MLTQKLGGKLTLKLNCSLEMPGLYYLAQPSFAFQANSNLWKSLVIQTLYPSQSSERVRNHFVSDSEKLNPLEMLGLNSRGTFVCRTTKSMTFTSGFAGHEALVLARAHLKGEGAYT